VRLSKNPDLENNPISNKLTDLVDTFKGAMPIVVALRNENLSEKHWQEIKDLIQHDFDINDAEFSLDSLIQMNVVQF
jgi:dynein heavy chain